MIEGHPQSHSARGGKTLEQHVTHPTIWALLGIPASDLSGGVGASVGVNVQMSKSNIAIPPSIKMINGSELAPLRATLWGSCMHHRPIVRGSASQPQSHDVAVKRFWSVCGV